MGCELEAEADPNYMYITRDRNRDGSGNIPSPVALDPHYILHTRVKASECLLARWNAN